MGQAGVVFLGLTPPRVCAQRQESGQCGQREVGGHLGKVLPRSSALYLSWLRQGPYLSFTQVIGDEPDEDGPGACVGQRG